MRRWQIIVADAPGRARVLFEGGTRRELQSAILVEARRFIPAGVRATGFPP